MWSVTVDEVRVAQLRKHDWSHIGKRDPFLRNPGPGDPFRVRMVDGRCFFLDQDKRCRIHNELGYDAKPEGCKAFPLHFTEVNGTSFARLSFYCPSVTSNTGKKLADQMRWARAVRKSAGDVARHDPLEVTGSLEASPREIGNVESQLLHWLEQTQHPLTDRLAAGAGLLAQISKHAESSDRGAVGAALKEAHRRGLSGMALAGREGGRAARSGPVLALFLGADCTPNKMARLYNFFRVRLFNLGLAKLSSRFIGAKGSWAQIRKIPFEPSPEGDALLTRYFVHKLRGRRHLAGEMSLLAGFNLLLVAYGVVSVLSRARAIAAGHSMLDDSDVTAAVQAADLLVIEHATIGQKPVFAALIEGILNEPTLCASLLARLEASK